MAFSSCYSVQYLLVLLPLAAAACAVLPLKGRRLAMLAANGMFFWAISGKLVLCLIFAAAEAYCAGRWLEALQKETDRRLEKADRSERRRIKEAGMRREKRVLVLAAMLQIGFLLILKYSPFVSENMTRLAAAAGMKTSFHLPAFLLPIGISFYTLQAVSYLTDVYHRRIPADRNPLRFALFMSFFPQIMEGPIVRYEQTAHALWNMPRVKYENAVFGVQRILFGILKKVVIADRANLMIRTVFGGYRNYDGLVIAAAAVLYTIQLYMDFSGTMDVMLGSAQIFGISLPENFQRPFFSQSISEFWKRWHITLGTWFRDYVFFPVCMSKPLKKLTVRVQKRFGIRAGSLASGGAALFLVWSANGFWHGAGWQYLFFGMYHFVLIFAGSLFAPAASRLTELLHIRKDSLFLRIFRIARTMLLVVIGELFFRAEGLRAGMTMFLRICTGFSLRSLQSGALFRLGMDRYDFLITAAVLAVLFVISLMQENGIRIRQVLNRQNMLVRYGMLYLLIMTIVIFGAYGTGYIPLDPIYAGF